VKTNFIDFCKKTDQEISLLALELMDMYLQKKI